MSKTTSRNSSSNFLFLTWVTALLLVSLTAAASAQEVGVAAVQEIPFDTDRGVWVYDSDGDTWPDLTEELAGTDPLDSSAFPGSSIFSLSQKELDFPSGSCRGPFNQQNNRLCITGVQNAGTYRVASATCSNLGARVCDYEDLNYIYFFTGNDANFNPNGKWLGHYTGDRAVHCGNRSITFNNDPDTLDFDGTCNANGSRTYWCCHTNS